MASPGQPRVRCQSVSPSLVSDPRPPGLQSLTGSLTDTKTGENTAIYEVCQYSNMFMVSLKVLFNFSLLRMPEMDQEPKAPEVAEENVKPGGLSFEV